jgi:acetolactate synthase-1/2/3 large subunit
VLVDIPKDVTAAKVEYTSQVPEMPQPASEHITDAGIDEAIRMIEASKKPFVFVGGGAVISGASDALKEFIVKLDAPVCDSLMGKGAFDGTDDHYTGMLGMHGTKTSNLGVSECDLLIALGVRFNDRILGDASRFARQAKILQIDIDPAEINKNVPTTAHITGDLKEVLKRLNGKLSPQSHAEWRAHIRDYMEKFPLSYHKEGLSGPFVIEKIYEMTKGDAIMVTEVGQHQMWAAQYYKYKNPRTLLTSGGLGTMGYGLGAAIGAQTAFPDKQVVNIAGDGCFRMNMNELATASREQLPLIEVIINNHVLGMVRQWQTLFYHQHYSATVLDDGVDYVKLSEAMGAQAARVTTQDEFEAAFAEALACKKPFVIDCIIDCDDKVWPMVAPGTPINESFDEADYKKKQS